MHCSLAEPSHYSYSGHILLEIPEVYVAAQLEPTESFVTCSACNASLDDFQETLQFHYSIPHTAWGGTTESGVGEREHSSFLFLDITTVCIERDVTRDKKVK